MRGCGRRSAHPLRKQSQEGLSSTAKQRHSSMGREKIGPRGEGIFEPIFQPANMVSRVWLLTTPAELTGLNRTWGSAYLSARRTCRLGVLSAGRSAGRKYGLIRHPPLVLAEKNGRKYGRTSGRPSRPAEGTAVIRPAGSAGRKYRPYLTAGRSAGYIVQERTSGWPTLAAESTAVPPAGRVGRPKVRFNPSPPPCSNTPIY